MILLVPKSVLLSGDGAKAILAAVYRRAPLPVVLSVHDEFSAVISAR